jgi:hypothetical protein
MYLTIATSPPAADRFIGITDLQAGAQNATLALHRPVPPFGNRCVGKTQQCETSFQDDALPLSKPNELFALKSLKSRKMHLLPWDAWGQGRPQNSHSARKVKEP